MEAWERVEGRALDGDGERSRPYCEGLSIRTSRREEEATRPLDRIEGRTSGSGMGGGSS